MIRRRSIVSFFAGAAVIAAAALALSACGGSGNDASASTAPSTTNLQPTTVGVANSGLGNILVNSQGGTLYMFSKDSGTTSACTGQCATFWPPLTASGAPTAGSGVSVSLVGTAKRSDGTSQVTYNDHPLYTFQKDQKAGDTNGQGVVAFGGSWSVVSPAGNAISAKPSSPSTSTPPTTPPTTSNAQPPPTTVAPANPGIPQNGGGDGDADNNGGPNDGDGGV